MSKSNEPYVSKAPVKTFRELLAAIEQMNDEQLDSQITVHDGITDEFYPAELKINAENDVLDKHHPVIFYE